MTALVPVRACVLMLALAGAAQAQPHGPSQREANTTLRMPLAPALFTYATERAFGNLTVYQPVALATPPGETNRLFVLEKSGVVVVITNLAAPQRTVFLDLSDRVDTYEVNGLLGITFHPGYPTNGYFYLYYTLKTNSVAGEGLHNRISRFEASPDDPNQGVIDTELILINQFNESGLHNAGSLEFGPDDGYLYISIGDEGWYRDSLDNSQRIDKDFFGGILRIDVDKQPGSRPPNLHPAATDNYAVPPDNPFIGLTEFNEQPVDPRQVRTEFWAVGLRNPWRIYFDRPTGRLYCGDVGEANLEEINLILKGGNYGWSYREGTTPGPKSDEAPTTFASINPIYQYYHGRGTNYGNATLCGVVYRGDRLSQLTGQFVCADHVSGNIWAVHEDGTPWPAKEWLAADPGISTLGLDPRNGDILMADLAENTLKRLTYNSSNYIGTPIPPTLADTGAFTDLATLTPNPGIVPYRVNLPFWSDGATKQRWFSVPDLNQTVQFSREGPWSFPPGTIWIKHFELTLTNGPVVETRRLETRFLVRDSNGVYGVTYRWDASQTNATLVPEEGMEEHFLTSDSLIPRIRTWRYPSRNECLACHNPAAGFALGFNTAQLNCESDGDGVLENQVRTLNRLGYFQTNVTDLHTLPVLANPTNHAFSGEYRVRSYLAANCAQCHHPGGASRAGWDARLTTPLSAANIVNGWLADSDGDANNQVIKPGSIPHSMILTRMSRAGPGRMPPIGSNAADQSAIGLLSAWITNDLPRFQTLGDWQTRHFNSPDATEAAPEADPDGDGASNLLEFLTNRNPLDATDVWKIGIHSEGDSVQVLFERVANRGFEVQWTTNVSGVRYWLPLNVPGNRPFVAAASEQAIVEDPIGAWLGKFYRVRVYEP